MPDPDTDLCYWCRPSINRHARCKGERHACQCPCDLRPRRRQGRYRGQEERMF